MPQSPDQLTQSADEHWMAEALCEAQKAAVAGEVPVGAVLVQDHRIIGRGYNAPLSTGDPTAHAEIRALREGAATLGNYRLIGTTLFVTLEPCAMCAGALVNARVERLVFGARDLRFGAVRTKFRIADSDLLNHRLEIVEGIRAAECVELLQSFFEGRREDRGAATK